MLHIHKYYHLLVSANLYLMDYLIINLIILVSYLLNVTFKQSAYMFHIYDGSQFKYCQSALLFLQFPSLPPEKSWIVSHIR